MATRSTGETTTHAYVNRERTHEVLALAEREGDALLWSVTERPAGSKDPDEAIVEELRTVPSALPGFVTDLESRLALSGEYYRLDPVRRVMEKLPTPTPVDLRSHAVPIPDAGEDTYLEYFHFHRSAGRSRVLLAMPRDLDAANPERFVLARYDFPNHAPRTGALSIVHPRLAPELVVGRVAGDHVVLPRSGYRKLYEEEDYREALGPDWREAATRVIESATRALLTPWRKRAKAEPEKAPAPSPLQAVHAALRSAVYRAARADHFPGGEAVTLVEEGPLAIQRRIKAARASAHYAEQIRLSLLEAGLYVEYGLAAGRPRLVDEWAPQLVRLSKYVVPDAPRG